MPLKIALLVCILLLPMLPTFWAIHHVATGRFERVGTKYGWLAIVAFLPAIGAIFYIIFGRKKRLGKMVFEEPS